MIDHFGIGCADMAAASRFYDGVLQVLGYHRVLDYGQAIGYGRAGNPQFWISATDQPEPAREMHLAFHARSEDTVRAFHAKALELGAEELHPPRLWPEYHSGYFGAFVRDPDGNNVEAVFHALAPVDAATS